MFWPLFFLIVLLGLAAIRADLRTASLVVVAGVIFYGLFGDSWTIFALLLLACLVVLVPLNITVLRQEWISRPAFAGFKRLAQALDVEALPAPEAGVPAWDFGLLDGTFDWPRFEALPPAQPSPLETGQIERLLGDYRRYCATTLEWAERRVWLCERGLFGLGIPQSYGGLGLSPLGQSALLNLLASFDARAAAEIGAPVRLAWVDLLLRSGTVAQCEHLLPAMASGEIVIGRPRHLLAGTGIAEAAGRAESPGVALRLDLEGAAPEPADATVLGFLVDVADPARLLDPAARGGLTCILTPRETEGLAVVDGRLRGSCLITPEDSVLGGAARIGRGLADLEDSDAVAGAIALPAALAGRIATAAVAAGAWARVHAPFEDALGERAAAQESLAAIGAAAYASRALAAGSAGAFSGELRPHSPAALARTFAVEQSRRVAAGCSDLGLEHSALRGLADAEGPDAGRELPPRLARPLDYTACILSGHLAFAAALRAVREKNPARALEQFDTALFGHFGHLLASASRTLVLALSAGSFSGVRAKSETGRRVGQRLNRYSAALAFASDVALSRVARDLASSRAFTARRGALEAARLTLTTWLGDALANLWLTVCVLKTFEDGGAQAADRATAEWVCAEALRAVEDALDQVLRHLSSRPLAWITRAVIFPLGRGASAPSDAANRQVAQRAMDETRLREALMPPDARLTVLDTALAATLDGEPLQQRVLGAQANAANAHSLPASARIERAFADGVIDAAQTQQLRDWHSAVAALHRVAINRRAGDA